MNHIFFSLSLCRYSPSNTRPHALIAQHSTSLEQPLRDILTHNMSTHILTQKHTTWIHPPQQLLEILEFRVYHLQCLGSQDMLFRPVRSPAIGLQKRRKFLLELAIRHRKTVRTVSDYADPAGIPAV